MKKLFNSIKWWFELKSEERKLDAWFKSLEIAQKKQIHQDNELIELSKTY